MYSTPSIYLEYVHRANSTYKIKTDDFFPYADDPWNFWTGRYNSVLGTHIILVTMVLNRLRVCNLKTHNCIFIYVIINAHVCTCTCTCT